MSLPSGSRASSSTSQLAKSASSSRRPSLHSDPPSHDDDDGDDELAIQTALRPKDKSHPPTAPAPATDEGIFHIVSRQPASLGIDPQYVVQLVKDGKKVRRDESEVRLLAPTLLAAYLAQNPPPPNPSQFGDKVIDLTIDDSEDDDDAPAPVKSKSFYGGDARGDDQEGGKKLRSKEDVAKRAKEVRRNLRAKGSAEAEEDDDDEEGGSGEEEDDDSAATFSGDDEDEEDEEDEEEEQGSEEEGGDASDDFDAPRRSTRARKQTTTKTKLHKKPTRASTRSTRYEKAFDLGGDGEAAVEGDGTDDGEQPTRRGTRNRPSGSEESGSEGEALSKVARRSTRSRDADFIDDDEGEEAEAGGGERIQDQHYARCGKCNEGPTSQLLPKLLLKRNKKKNGGANKRRARANDDLKEDSEQEESRVRKLGAWLECGVCTSSFHFGCLPDFVRKDFLAGLKAEHALLYPPPPEEPIVIADDAESSSGLVVPPPPPPPPPRPAHVVPKRDKKELNPKAVFVIAKCTLCKKVGGRRCFVCGVNGRKITVTEDAMQVDGAAAEIPPLMFRCRKCKRAAHYPCLPQEEPDNPLDAEEHAESYLRDGECHQCWSYKGQLDVILAWAEDEKISEMDTNNTVVEADDVRVDVEVVLKKDDNTGKVFSIPSAKDPSANAQYLVKWQGESYRQLEWIPHAYLVAAYPAKLTNFLARGSTVTFDTMTEDEPEDGEEEKVVVVGSAPLPDPNATERIPLAWSTVDRVLDVFYKAKKGDGMVRFENYRNLPTDPKESIQLVEECYFKWGELPYSASTTEAPPEEGEDGYPAYVAAYEKFLIASSSKMRVPNLSGKHLSELDKVRDVKKFVPLKKQPDFIKGGKLMPFQLEGVNFLYFQWWKRTGCILADEMGLGKTVQIITFLSVLSVAQGARPFLVAVPNSTMGNWVREFERWAPSMRVVPYGGDGPSRKIVEDYELFDATGKVLKTHVVIATYEALEKNVAVFRKVTRWDCLVVDEGQRLKSGTDGLLFAALQSLNVNHRVLLSGTPLNNNIVELFNLLHFIDPEQWGNREELKEKYEELTSEKVEEIRAILKPYFLRRTKELVLDLPPLNEIVVPVTMTALQRQLYKGILERNAAAIESIFQKTSSKSGAKTKTRKANFNNILMELRKLLGHPYLVSPDLEPLNVTQAQAHANLRDASAKFILLAKMLPKLKAAGHRVLVFSQFKISLNIVEDFLRGENMKYLRLDGDTAQLDRQRGIDAFQKDGSDFFCYLLSTRAGGVGINLTKADTVIMFDQDFNPHQDIQAISRAHRIGQKNPVRVFKLMVKGTCEERIFQAGTKKLGLDHLIIQRLDAAEDEANEIESVLQYGAKAIFDDKEAEATAIRFTDADIDKLLARSAAPASPKKDGAAAAFSHAKIWEVNRDSLEDVVIAEDEEMVADDGGFWNNLLVQQEEADRLAKLASEANAGRGKRNRREVVYANDGLPAANKRQKGDAGSPEGSDEDFHAGGSNEDSGDDDFEMDLDKDDVVRPEKQGLPHGLARPKGAEKGKKARAVGGYIITSLPADELSRRAAHKAQRRIQKIDELTNVAAVFHDVEVNGVLQRARTAERKEQTRLLKEATARVFALLQKPFPPPPPKPVAANGSGPSKSSYPAPKPIR